MKQIFNIDGDVVSDAWIGESAPMPDGWYADVNTAMKANKANKPAPVDSAGDDAAPDAPKKRGRPRKDSR